MMVADAAQAVDGKLYILGGGWSVVGPSVGPMALALKIEIPWDQANEKHSWRIILADADGRQVELDTPEGPQTVVIDGEFEMGRPPGMVPGTPLDLPLAISIGPLPLAPGSRYVWQLSIDGATKSDWQVAFATRAALT